jgi:hypothetical protein
MIQTGREAHAFRILLEAIPASGAFIDIDVARRGLQPDFESARFALDLFQLGHGQKVDA